MKLQKGDYIRLKGVSDETLKEVRDAFVRAGFNEYEDLDLRSDYECYGIDRDGDCIFHDKSCRYSKSSRLLTPEQVINWDKLDDGWIEWSGDECPVADGVKVDIRFRYGGESEGLNCYDLNWGHSGLDVIDIIAYRICNQKLSPEDAQAEDEEFARIAKESIVTKQERYLQEGGKDLIDKWAERYTQEEFRLIMLAMIEKYMTRMGRKDSIASECRKIADYANRLALVEEGRE